MSSAVIVSVVWFTSTSRPRDQICEPYTLKLVRPDFKLRDQDTVFYDQN